MYATCMLTVYNSIFSFIVRLLPAMFISSRLVCSPSSRCPCSRPSHPFVFQPLVPAPLRLRSGASSAAGRPLPDPASPAAAAAARSAAPPAAVPAVWTLGTGTFRASAVRPPSGVPVPHGRPDGTPRPDVRPASAAVRADVGAVAAVSWSDGTRPGRSVWSRWSLWTVHAAPLLPRV